MIAWVDLETTGLDPQTDDVIELGCIVTDDQLNETARFHRVIHTIRSFDSLNSAVQDMHFSNGLWREVKSSSHSVKDVDDQFAGFLYSYARGAQLAGSTISFDREFMRKRLPISLAILHYRNIDTTTLNELGRRFWPLVHESRPQNAEKAHRAMDDIEESIRVTRHYLNRLEVK